MSKILSAVLLSAAITTSTLVVSATPASADTPRCVTHREYLQVRKGMTKARVHQIFDIRGEFAGGFAGGYTRFYGSCAARRIGGGDGGAGVSYDGWTGRVVEKRWI